MINLLPPELKRSYRYAHRNVRLVGWVIAFGLGFIGLGLISTGGAVYIHQSERSYLAQVVSGQQQLQQENLSSTQTQVENITNNLKLAVEVLSKEVLFSKLLAQLATVMPSNSVLTDLNISQTQGAVDLTAMTTDYATATQVQVNLADPANKIFSRADIVSINCSASNGSADAHYPCTVVIRALFASNNPFLFINAQGSKKS